MTCSEVDRAKALSDDYQVEDGLQQVCELILVHPVRAGKHPATASHLTYGCHPR